MARKAPKNKSSVSYWHYKLLDKPGVFSRYIRLRDSVAYMEDHPQLNEVGAACISCGVFYPVKKLQAGHFITVSKTNIKYHERNVHAQCYNCNINLKGNWAGYLETMTRKYGQGEVDNLMEIRNITKKFTIIELENLYNYCVNEIKKFEKVVGKVW